MSDDGTVVVNVTTSALAEETYNLIREYTEAAQEAREAEEMLVSYGVGGVGVVIGLLVALLFLRRF